MCSISVYIQRSNHTPILVIQQMFVLLCYAILCALLGITHLQKEFLEYSRIVFQVDVAQAGIKRVFFQSFNGFVVSAKELCKLFSA